MTRHTPKRRFTIALARAVFFALVAAVSPEAMADEPEEPDFAFLTGGPYTQRKNSPQFIFPAAWGRRTTRAIGGDQHHSEYGALFRAEYGLTDRWELDAIFSTAGERDDISGRRITSTFALSDSVIGVRYRLLRESSAPFTLTMGPQFIFPTGNLAKGTGNSSEGWAWDIAAAKDWGGPVFIYASANYSFFPSVNPGTTSGPQHFPLHNLFGATAVVLRPMERKRGPNHHDLHAFFEWGIGREEGVEFGPPMEKSGRVSSIFSPGIRYGILTDRERLFEFGVSFPIGLNHAAPHGGIIVQFQVENLFGYGK